MMRVRLVLVRPRRATCTHQHRHPDQTGSDVQTVRADQREERRREAAAIRGLTVNNQVMEFAGFHR